MLRPIALISCAAGLAASASAQCFSPSGTSVVPLMTSVNPIEDEGLTSDIALTSMFFPIGGTNWTHIVVDANGEVYLTDGTGVVNRSFRGVSDINEARGGIGGSPRISPLNGDNIGRIAEGWDILLDQSVVSQVKVSWLHLRTTFGAVDQDFSHSVTLFANGEVQFDYAGFGFNEPPTYPNSFDWAVISAGNDVGTGAEVSSDFSAPGSTSIELAYMNTWGDPFQLQSSSVRFVPSGGGFAWTVPCTGNPAATISSYGEGCYDNSTWASVYQNFGGSAAAEATLENTSWQYIPSGVGGYFLTTGAAALRPITNAVLLPVSDDGHLIVTPSVPFNYLGTTPVADIAVSGNGGIFMNGFGQINAVYYGLTGFLQVTEPVFIAYGRDLNPADPAGGRVYTEEDSGVLYITFDGVVIYSTTEAQTFQFQLDLSTGNLAIAYGDLSTGGGTFPVLFGYSPGGAPVADMGGIDLLTDLPFVTSVDATSPPLVLSASPRPVSTGAFPVWPNPANFGETVTYQVDNVPETVTGSGQAVGLIIFSFSQNTGLDLGFIGAPGCSAFVNSMDVPVAFVNPGASASVQFSLPSGLTPGAQFYTQAIALVSGANAFGLVTSNGIASVVSDN